MNIDSVGVTNYNNQSEVSDSIYKQYYLQVRGYNVHRVWITDWFNNKEQEVNKIIEKLNLNKEMDVSKST